MLNSRYAPVIALAVLGVVLVAVLGWFFAIRPQLGAATDAAEQASTVRANAAVVRASSAQLDEYAALVAEDDAIAAAIDLNAPSRLDTAGFRARVQAAVSGSGVVLLRTDQEDGELIDGWELEPALLVSNQVANLFSTGPTAQPGAEPQPTASPAADGTVPAAIPGAWTPVVSPSVEVGPVTGDIRRVIFQFEVLGSASQVDVFLSLMADPGQQIFQVYDVTQSADSTTDTLVDRASAPNDMIATIIGALYVHGADLSILDEDALGDAAPNDSAFASSGTN